jgi:hypothetical protein
MNDQPESPDSRIPPRVKPGISKKTYAWPLVLGVIVLVMAGVLTLFNIASIVLKYSGLDVAGGDMGLEMERAIYDKVPVIVWLGWIFAGVCFLFLWGFGIGLIRRRRWGVFLGRGLSVLILVNVVLSIVGFYVSYPVMDAQFQDMPGGASVKVIALVSTAFGFLINIVVSVAILSWLGSARAKKEWLTWP